MKNRFAPSLLAMILVATISFCADGDIRLVPDRVEENITHRDVWWF